VHRAGASGIRTTPGFARRRSCLAVGLVAVVGAGAALWPAPVGASSAQAGRFAGELEVDADTGEANAITIRVRRGAGESPMVTAADHGADLTAGDRCTSGPASGDARCTIPGLYVIFVELGDGNDSLAVDNRDRGVGLTIGGGRGGDSIEVGPRGGVCIDGGPGGDRLRISTPSQACIVEGSGGADTLTGSVGQDRLDGGSAADEILGRGGDDYLDGGPADDTIDGGKDGDTIDGDAGDDHLNGEAGGDGFGDGPGDDEMQGGAGDDRFDSSFFFDSGDDAYLGGSGRDRFTYFCPSCEVSLDGVANDGQANRGEADNVETEMASTPSRIPPDPDTPGASYGSGRDVLIGDAGANVLRSHRGSDRLMGRAGRDRLEAGGDDDRVLAADGTTDALVSCGPGTDTAVVDRLDEPMACEDVTVKRP